MVGKVQDVPIRQSPELLGIAIRLKFAYTKGMAPKIGTMPWNKGTADLIARKQHIHEYYLKNRERLLEYQRQQRVSGRAEELRKIRRKKNVEQMRNRESLWEHQHRKERYKKKREYNRSQYEYLMDKTGDAIRYRKWTEEDFQFLRDNYKTMSDLEMALALSRTWAATRRKMEALRLIKQPQRIKDLLAH